MNGRKNIKLQRSGSVCGYEWDNIKMQHEEITYVTVVWTEINLIKI